MTVNLLCEVCAKYGQCNAECTNTSANEMLSCNWQHHHDMPETVY